MTKNNTVVTTGLIITLVLGAYGWTTAVDIKHDKKTEKLEDCVEANQRELLNVLALIQTDIAVTKKDIEYIKKKK